MRDLLQQLTDNKMEMKELNAKGLHVSCLSE